MKRKFGMISALIPAAIMLWYGSHATHAAYADVPEGALGNEVKKAVDYGLMNGLSNTVFGYSAPMTRAQFVTVLDRMLLSKADKPLLAQTENAPLPDTMNLPDAFPQTYYTALSHAVACDVVETSVPFRPNEPVTREAMAEMLVKALGLDNAALSLSSNRILSFSSEPSSGSAVENLTPFLDLPEGKEGYAAIAYAIGMTNGLSKNSFAPNATATRAQAAAMLTRVHEKLQRKTDFRHGFYAVTDAPSALNITADVVSLEWSHMAWNNANAVLMTKPNGSRDRYIPSDHGKIVETLTAGGAKLYLSVFMDTSGGIEELLASASGRAQAVKEIVYELTVPYPELEGNPYSGVTIDFKGLHQEQRELFTQFLSELKGALSPTGKGIYVCVPPYLSAGHWDDGYDCRAIAALADKLILTAYDYHSQNLNNFLGTEAYKNEASAPLDRVYLSLLKLTEEVADSSKLVLGVSSRHTAWEIGRNNDQLLSGVPVSPDTETLRRYLESPDTQRGWSIPYQMPYAIYSTPEGSRYFVWYENAQSIRKKTDIAQLLGITGLSCWNMNPTPLYAPW